MFLIPINTVFVAEGNPAPIPEITIDTPDGGPSLQNGTQFRFATEKVTVWIDEKARVIGKYQLINKVNKTISEAIALPFYNTPFEIGLKVNGIETEFSWKMWSSDLRFFEGEEFHAIVFNVSAHPHGSVNITVDYRRNITRDSYYGDRLFSYIYLARTGKIWNDHIDHAVFLFYVNVSLVANEYENGNFINNVFGADSRTGWDLDILLDQTEFIMTPVDGTEGYRLLKREYTYWTPEKDVGIMWILKGPRPSIKLTGEVLEDGVLLHLDGSDSIDLDSEIISFEWNIWNRSSIKKRCIGKEMVDQTTLNKTGFKVIGLEITDEHGLKGSAYHKVLFVKQGERIDITVTDIDDGWEFYHEDSEYSWSVDGKPISTGEDLTHTFRNPGIRELEVRSGDPDLHISRTIKVIVLLDPDYEEDNRTVFDPFVLAISSVVLMCIVILVALVLIIRKTRY